jgi:hypothetical protein
MTTQSIDTNPEVERVLISLIRKLSTEEKLNQTLQFSSSIINLSKRAIARANPDLSEDEKKLLFVEYHYGAELANKLRSFKELNNTNEH